MPLLLARMVSEKVGEVEELDGEGGRRSAGASERTDGEESQWRC